MTFANRMDPYQAAWSGSKLFDTLKVFLEESFENLKILNYFEEKNILERQNSFQNLWACEEVKLGWEEEQ